MKFLPTVLVSVLGFALVSCNIQAQVFSQADLERLLKNNKYYNDCIGAIDKNQKIDFNNVDLEHIQSENDGYASEISELEQERNRLSLSFLENEGEENTVWNKIASFDARIEYLKSKMSENDKLSGKDYSDKLEDFIKKVDLLVADSVIPVFDKNKVIFNKLPRYYFNPDFLRGCSFKRFMDTGDKAVVEQYLNNAYSISMLFSNSDTALLYNNEKCASDTLAILSYSKILALHPKMLLFDFDRFGFYKIDDYVSKEHFNDVVLKLPRFSADIKNEIDDVQKRLLQCRSDRVSKIIQLSGLKTEDIEAKKAAINDEYAILEDKLMSTKKALLIKQGNADITDPSDSRIIFNKIEQEINEIVNEICIRDNIATVINNSCPERIVYYKPLSKGGEYNSIVNYSNEKYYSLLFDKTFTSNSLRTKSIFIDLLDLLEVALHKRTTYSLNLDNFPIVAYKGNVKSLNSEVLEKLYNKYHLDSSILIDLMEK